MHGSRRILAALAALAAVITAAIAVAAAGAADSSRPATALAAAYARQEPTGARIDYVSVRGDGETAGDATRVAASTDAGKGRAHASAEARDVSMFDGLVTAQFVSVDAVAAAAGTDTSGSVSGLQIAGHAAPAPDGRTRYDLGGYGRLVALGSGRTGIVGLRAKLTRDYKSFKAGDVISVAYASARARNAVEADPPAAAKPEPAAPAKAKKRAKKPLTAEQRARRKLRARHRREAADLKTLRGYAFPVAGKHDFSDDFGAPRADVPEGHQGNDVFADFGTPIVAVAGGRLYRVGTRKIAGNRLWLRDHHGHRFFYAHLADFAASAYNGADVRAGEVIGFVGTTGDAEQTPPHLHFEIHLRDGAAINPFETLGEWDARGDVKIASNTDPGARPGALVVVRDFLQPAQ